MPSIENFNCIEPGINSLDELHRALRDVHRLTTIWARIAREHEESFIFHESLCRSSFDQRLAATRANWMEWEPAIERALRAITDADLAKHEITKREILEPLGVLNDIFRPFPAFLKHEKPGDHLINRGRGPLAASRDEGSQFPTDRVIAALEQLDELVITLSLLSPREPSFSARDQKHDPSELTKITSKKLQALTKRTNGTTRRWALSAMPRPIAPRKKGQAYTFGELESLAYAAESLGDDVSAAAIRGQIAKINQTRSFNIA